MSLGVFLIMLFNPILNTPQNIPHVMLHISVVKSQNPQSKIFQISFTSLITMEFVTVTLAINLNHELQPRTIEVDDVFVNRSLSQEGIAQHFAVFQLVPQKHLSQRAAVPEFSRTWFQFWVVIMHC